MIDPSWPSVVRRAAVLCTVVCLGSVCGIRTARAESDEFNLHGELALGWPVVGPLSAPGDDGRDRIIPAGWVSLDWQFEAPWAAEALLGLGRQIERSDVPGRTGAGFWQLAFGVRRRFADDQKGYHDDPNGNWLGNFWASAHVGYAFLDDTQFGLDVAGGYEFSVARPIQVGLLVRALMMLGGQASGADVALFGGVGASIPLSVETAVADADGDGLDDAREAALGTNPALADTDHDGLPDGVEVRHGTDPLERDTDGDGLDDGFEDRDADGQLGLEETDPRRADTDRGGIPDGDEVNNLNLDPRNPRDDDTDRDGVAEYADRCPDTPSGTDVDGFGCPEMAETLQIEGIQFATGSAEVLPSSFPSLHKARGLLENHPTVRVEVAGHTDSLGREVINQRLSRQRALAVRLWLIENGIAPSRLTARGYGSASPIAPNNTPEGRARNRRIEFRRLPAR